MEGLIITKLLVVSALIVLFFRTKKLRSLGDDLGAAIKGFKNAMNDDSAPGAADLRLMMWRVSQTAKNKSSRQRRLVARGARLFLPARRHFI